MNAIKVPADWTGEYSLIPGPVFNDGCDHGAACYVCSFEVFNHERWRHQKNREDQKSVIEKYDLYLFPNTYHGTEVCIRYGSDGHEYISPGSLAEFLNRANAEFHTRHRDAYYTAARILIQWGKTSWEPRQ